MKGEVNFSYCLGARIVDIERLKQGLFGVRFYFFFQMM